MGLNMPAKVTPPTFHTLNETKNSNTLQTVVFTALRKWDGDKFRQAPQRCNIYNTKPVTICTGG
jgi:hypothetical protein